LWALRLASWYYYQPEPLHQEVILDWTRQLFYSDRGVCCHMPLAPHLYQHSFTADLLTFVVLQDSRFTHIDPEAFAKLLLRPLLRTPLQSDCLGREHLPPTTYILAITLGVQQRPFELEPPWLHQLWCTVVNRSHSTDALTCCAPLADSDVLCLWAAFTKLLLQQPRAPSHHIPVSPKRAASPAPSPLSQEYSGLCQPALLLLL
jgi:hypothetical protein